MNKILFFLWMLFYPLMDALANKIFYSYLPNGYATFNDNVHTADAAIRLAIWIWIAHKLWDCKITFEKNININDNRLPN